MTVNLRRTRVRTCRIAPEKQRDSLRLAGRHESLTDTPCVGRNPRYGSVYATRQACSQSGRRRCLSVSFELLVQALKVDLPCVQKMVVIHLADMHNDDEGHAWPSVATLAKRCGVSKRTVQRTLGELVEMGVVMRAPSSRHPSHSYVLDLSRVVHRGCQSVTPKAVEKVQGGDNLAPPPCQSDTPGGDNLSPNPLSDLLIEKLTPPPQQLETQEGESVWHSDEEIELRLGAIRDALFAKLAAKYAHPGKAKRYAAVCRERWTEEEDIALENLLLARWHSSDGQIAELCMLGVTAKDTLGAEEAF